MPRTERVPLKLLLKRLRPLLVACRRVDALRADAETHDHLELHVRQVFDTIVSPVAPRRGRKVSVQSWFAFSDRLGAALAAFHTVLRDGRAAEIDVATGGGQLTHAFKGSCMHKQLPEDLVLPAAPKKRRHARRQSRRPPAAGRSGSVATVAVPGMRFDPNV